LKIPTGVINGRALGVCRAKIRDLATRAKTSPLALRLAHGAFWSLFGQVTARTLGLLSSIFVARLLGKNGFGELGIVQSTANMFQVLAGTAIGLTATKHVAEFRNSDPSRAGRIIALSNVTSVIVGAVLALALIISSPWLAQHTLAAPQLAPLLRIGALLLFFGAFSGAQGGALSGFECFKENAQITLWSGLIGFPIMIAAVYFWGLRGAVWSLVLSMALTCAMNVFVLRSVMNRYQVPLSLRTSASELPVLWKFGLPTVLGGLVSAPAYWACNAMLVNRQGGYAEMGILNAANQWWAAVLFLPGMLAQVVLPVMTERLSGHGHAQARRLLWASVAANLVIVTPVIILGSVLSRDIMASYGSQFAGASLTLVVLLVAAGVQALQTPVLNLLTAKGRMWTVLLLLLSWAVLLLALNTILVKWGAFGVASARMVSYFVSSFWVSFVAYRLMTADAAHDFNDSPNVR
jgi:O-antigen/teichoic acid export membrane protein